MIPHVFHRIWLGGEEPAHLQAYGATWMALNPGWELRQWTDANCPPVRNADVFDRAEEVAPQNVGQLRADVLRYELLSAHGGVYIDADFECLKPLEPLLDGVSCFVAYEEQGVWANNAIMGAEPGNPFIEALIEGLAANVAANRGSKPNKMTGPQYLTRLLRERDWGVTIFGQALFYPYSYRELHRRGQQFPKAYGAHHWANRRRAQVRA